MVTYTLTAADFQDFGPPRKLADTRFGKTTDDRDILLASPIPPLVVESKQYHMVGLLARHKGTSVHSDESDIVFVYVLVDFVEEAEGVDVSRATNLYWGELHRVQN